MGKKRFPREIMEKKRVIFAVKSLSNGYGCIYFLLLFFWSLFVLNRCQMNPDVFWCSFWVCFGCLLSSLPHNRCNLGENRKKRLFRLRTQKKTKRDVGTRKHSKT